MDQRLNRAHADLIGERDRLEAELRDARERILEWFWDRSVTDGQLLAQRLVLLPKEARLEQLRDHLNARFEADHAAWLAENPQPEGAE